MYNFKCNQNSKKRIKQAHLNVWCQAWMSPVEWKIPHELLKTVVKLYDESGLCSFGQPCNYVLTIHCWIVTKYRSNSPMVFSWKKFSWKNLQNSQKNICGWVFRFLKKFKMLQAVGCYCWNSSRRLETVDTNCWVEKLSFKGTIVNYS